MLRSIHLACQRELVGSEAILEHHLRAALVLGMVAERQGDLFGFANV
jgi:hypothetical protein